MSMFKSFIKGYMQTMLFGIEERPSFKMHENFYVFLHVMNHCQFVAMAIQSNHNTTYQDFKLSYLQDFTQFFILNNTLKSSLSYSLAMVLIVVSFLIQVTLMLFIIFSTLVRIWTTNLIRKNSSTGNVNTGLQNWVLQFNETLHWYFVIYPVVYLQVAVISFSSLSCNSISLIPESECEITSGIQFLVIVPLVISFVHGQILIYIMRNHRFHETNSLKRRYSGLLLLNNTLILVEVFAHYVYQFENSDVIKYVCANFFALNQIYDQLFNFPYRDPVRIPSIRLAFIYTWIVAAVTFYRFTGLILEENLFFLIVIPLGFWAVVGEGISQQFQYYAVLNYNSNFQLEEKHIIIAVDQFYKHYLDFMKNLESQLKFFQFIMIHRLYCKNSKCYSKDKRFDTLDMSSVKDLHIITLSVIKCVFKTAQNWLFSMQNTDNYKSHNTSEDLQFEQLQLQFISFVSEIAIRPLIGYMELRSYQNNKLNKNSIYFVEITNKLSAQLEKQIMDNQERQNKNDVLLQDQRSQLVEISLQQQWYTQSLYENLLVKFIQLVDSKIHHWQGLINGYPNLNPFQASTQQLCSQINELREMIDEHIGVPQEWFDLKSTTSKGLAVKRLTHAELNINVVTLKLYSLFYSLLLNDFDRTNYIEQYVKDITSNDRQKELDIIDNISLITDQTTIVLVSLVKQKGKIRNKNQLALANFFHYIDANDFKDSVLTVHHLLPKSMIKAHEMLIDKFIQTGSSEYFIRKINGYYQTKQGYIEKSYVKLGNLFEEKDDYVLTASILKCNMSNQIMVVDQEGKIVGISEQLFKIIHQTIPEVTMEFLNEFCHAFLLFPQLALILKQNYSKCDDQEHIFIQDEDHLLYLSPKLIELNSQYVRDQYEKLGINVNMGLDSMHLSSWRSWKSVDQSMTQSAQGKKLFGQSLSLLDPENISFQYEFLLSNKLKIEDYLLLKTKLKITYQKMKVKNFTFPYFVIEMDHIQELASHNKFYNKYPSMVKQVEIQYHMLKSGQSQKQESFNESLGFGFDIEKQSGVAQSLKITQMTSKWQKPNSSLPEVKIDEEQHKRMKQVIQEHDSQILCGIDTSNHALMQNKNIVELNDISGIDRSYFDQPLQKHQNQEDDEFLIIDQHFKQLDRFAVFIDQENSQIPVKDDSQQEIEENLEKHSSVNKQGQDKNDLLEVLVQNRKNRQLGDHHDMQEEENNRKRSVASSSRTSTSKSPFLLVRSLYQLGTFQGTIRQVTAAMVLYLSLAFALVFIEINTIQSNYDILQTNINYVTLPETLNFYFLKMAMFSWLGLQSNLKVMTYSDFINKQMKEELEAMKSEIDVKLNDLYQGIIQYEKEILSSDLLLISINDMKEYRQELDLTQLIQQIQLHSFSYIESQTDQSAISDAMFFRMNIPYIHRFALTFISLLNDNLIYYEDKIINDIVVLTAIFIPVFTVLLLYLLYMVGTVTAYERQILMLITRVSEKQAEDIIIKLYEVKAVLVEPSQLEWKKINYFDVNYDINIDQQMAMKAMNTRSVITGSNSKQSSILSKLKSKSSKSSRNYQNNSLAQRIYDLQLTNSRNYITIGTIWIIVIAFIIGAILVTMGQVTDIKPTLNLNLQLVRFKLRFDSLVVQGEIIKTQKMIVKQLETQYSDNLLNLDTTEIMSLFVGQVDGFQDSMTIIYDSLAGNSGLLAAQKEELLNYFEASLCTFMAQEIPFCSVSINSEEFLVPSSFIEQNGNPYPQDNNYEFVSGGITNTVQEFTKTLNIYFNTEIQTSQFSSDTEYQTRQFLNSTAHINQFVEYYLDQGKLLGTISVNLFEQNVLKLNQATTIMSLYIYIGGYGVVILLLLIITLWLNNISERQKLMRLSLTLIPYEVLLEPKTLSALKQL